MPLTKPSTSGTRPTWRKPRGGKRGDSEGTWVVIMKIINLSGVGSGMKIN